MVTDVYRQGSRPDDKEGEYAALNDIIIVEVQNLDKLTGEAKCKGQPPTCKPRQIVLYLNGRQIKGLIPESGAPEFNELNAIGQDGTLQFHLLRTADSKEHWADLLGFDILDWSTVRPVEVSVGLEDDVPVATQVKPGGKKFSLERFRGRWFWLWLALLLIILLLMRRFGGWRNLLRDTDANVTAPELAPYSLGRSQALWWFVLTILSFIFIWLVTGQYDLSPSVVILLGIGFGTSVGSFLIDKPATPAAPNPPNPPNPPAPPVKTSTTFLNDLLSDGKGISLHRFQMVVWTLVLGILFIHGVLGRLAMPEFSETLLALMGISSGTFLAVKAGSK